MIQVKYLLIININNKIKYLIGAIDFFIFNVFY